MAGVAPRDTPCEPAEASCADYTRIDIGFDLASNATDPEG
jgi:hypothetical protein